MLVRIALTVVAALVAAPAVARADSDLYSIALDGSDRRNLTRSAEREGLTYRCC